MKYSKPMLRTQSRFPLIVLGLTWISFLIVGCSHGMGKPQQHQARIEPSLSSLLFEGPELHPSLRTRKMGSQRDARTGVLVPKNPHISTDLSFVQNVARAGSQGRLDKDGMIAALFARYTTGENELGFYGLEADSTADANEREEALRGIWAHNASSGRSRVYRSGLVLLVIWHTGLPPECWNSIQSNIALRLNFGD